jgi:serine protease Do
VTTTEPPDGVAPSEALRPDEEDDLAGVDTPLARLVRASRRWLAALVAAALLVPTGAWLLQELDFRRSGEAVVQTLQGELRAEDLGATILLVRTVGCTPAQGGSGSGFVADLGGGPVIVTNRHVVEGTRQVGVRALDGSAIHRVSQVLVSDRADVAVLQVAEPDALPPAMVLADRGVGPGDEVRLVGFPAARPFTSSGTVVRVRPDQLLLDLEVRPGASGSPVVTGDGQVVGQVFAVTAGGRGLATPVQRLREAAAELRPMASC